ncbi:hypothetical protein AAJ76_2200017665 [Vairimorpha ceranae]|uniref:Uncharacterized protein n=1 Tax=Vairimorpha ceranae TaxID=40302 RepID=A0A0F9YS76_9MICR|nr:hypothetical protein AAJ76_2200017665 [Vairimorpha ceranae]KKO75397.1 hypothetical protein AAJ76_2200017665 [Vairimorpha ceranae]
MVSLDKIKQFIFKNDDIIIMRIFYYFSSNIEYFKLSNRTIIVNEVK